MVVDGAVVELDSARSPMLLLSTEREEDERLERDDERIVGRSRKVCGAKKDDDNKMSKQSAT